MVDLVGIEPTTSSMPWKRAPSCATGPLFKAGQLFIFAAVCQIVKRRLLVAGFQSPVASVILVSGRLVLIMLTSDAKSAKSVRRAMTFVFCTALVSFCCGIEVAAAISKSYDSFYIFVAPIYVVLAALSIFITCRSIKRLASDNL